VSQLADFQRALATDILFNGVGSHRYFRDGFVSPELGVSVHRNTVLAALVNAMRMTCPTLHALVDAEFFEQSVRDYSRSNPPHSGCLSEFGSGYAEFLENYPPARGFRFFGDVVRFDFAIDEVSRDPPGVYRAPIRIGRGITCRLLRSLRHVAARYPVDAIREEAEAGRFDGLERIDMTPRLQHFAVWRSESGSSVKRMTEPAAAFLTALLAGSDGEGAVNEALERFKLEEVLSAIQREILAPPLSILSFEKSLGVDP